MFIRFEAWHPVINECSATKMSSRSPSLRHLLQMSEGMFRKRVWSAFAVMWVAAVLVLLPAATPPARALEAEFGRVADCPTGYTKVLDVCTRDAKSIYALGRCYLPCPSGYVNTGVICYRAPDTLGPSSMSCHSDELLEGGR